MGNAIAFNKITGKSSLEMFQLPNKSRIGSLPPDMNFDALKHLFDSAEEELLVALLEKMRKPFEELESLVANLGEIPRTAYLLGQIETSLLSSDPVKSLQDAVDLIRTIQLKKKFLDYFSRCNKVDPLIAERLLIETFMMGKYYRNQLKK